MYQLASCTLLHNNDSGSSALLASFSLCFLAGNRVLSLDGEEVLEVRGKYGGIRSFITFKSRLLSFSNLMNFAMS